MKLIAHRGNLDGPQPQLENQPDYLVQAISKGYDVETDVWLVNKQLWLGHDQPDWLIDETFLSKIAKHAWFHAKNHEAFDFLLRGGYHCFWHDQDDFTLTSRGYAWAYPGITPLKYRTVCVQQTSDEPPADAYGVCSDFVGRYAS